MIEKRFTWEYSHYDSVGEIIDWSRNECIMTDYLQKYEFEEWCQELTKIVDENTILWKEIKRMIKQGAELSSTFKEKYLDNISTEYDKFWRMKIKQAKKNKVIE